MKQRALAAARAWCEGRLPPEEAGCDDYPRLLAAAMLEFAANTLEDGRGGRGWIARADDLRRAAEELRK